MMPRPLRIAGWALVAGALPALAACASPCREYQERTGAALSGARNAGAEVFAPGLWAGAQKLAEQAEGECRRQESRFPPLRSFQAAGEIHGRAREEAERARAAAVTNRGILRQEALNARYRAGMMLEAARLAVGKPAPGSPAGGRIGEVERLQRELESIDRVLAAGDFASARERSEAVGREAVRLEALAHGGTPADH